MKKIYSYLRFLPVLCLFFTANTPLHAQTFSWKSLQMGAGGFVSGIITSKQQQNLIYCRTDVGGAYRWNASTSAWVPLLDWVNATQSGFYGVESLAIDPSAPNKLYMLTGINYFDNGKTAILKSEDYGQTFTTIDVTAQFKAHGNGLGRSNGERLQVDPNLGSVLYVGTRANGLWKSTNAGETWTRLAGLDVNTTANSNGISFVLIDPASGTAGNASQTIYVGVSRYASVGDNFYKSTDGGQTFTAISGGPSAFMPQRAVLANGQLVMNYANGAGPNGTTVNSSVESMNSGGIYRFSPSGNSWTNITPSGITRAWGGLSVDPANPNRMVASTINNYQLQYGPSSGGAYGDRIYLTTNGGATWTDVVARGFTLNNSGVSWINGQAIHWAGSVEFDPFDTRKVLVTSGNGIFSNSNIDDAASPWKFDIKDLEELVPRDIVSIPGGPLFSVVFDYDGFKHTDLTQYGQRITPTMGTTIGIAYAGNNTNFMVRVGQRMYYSTNQGATWTQTTGALMGTQGRVTITADGSTILHAPSNSSATYFSKDNGATWTASSITVSSAIPVADMVNANKVYIYNSGSGNFNVSNNAGTTFSTTVNIGTNGSKIIRTVPGKEGDIWVPMYNGGLKRSVNSGTSFTTIAGVQACSAIGFGKEAPGATYFTLYMWGTVGGVTGIFQSINEGASWVRINDNATMFGGPGNGQFVIGDMNTFGVAYMSTVGRGVVIGQSAEALPVRLSRFNLQTSNNIASLRWSTATEINNVRFDIERSNNGTTYTKIGEVATKAINGNSTNQLEYSFNDDIRQLQGAIYYRLKQVNKDQQYALSDVLRTSIDPDNNIVFQINPNPSAVGKLNLNVRLNKEQRVIFRIINMSGNVVYKSADMHLSAGASTIPIPAINGMVSGSYIAEMITGKQNKVEARVRFVVQ